MTFKTLDLSHLETHLTLMLLSRPIIIYLV